MGQAPWKGAACIVPQSQQMATKHLTCPIDTNTLEADRTDAGRRPRDRQEGGHPMTTTEITTAITRESTTAEVAAWCRDADRVRNRYQHST